MTVLRIERSSESVVREVPHKDLENLKAHDSVKHNLCLLGGKVLVLKAFRRKIQEEHPEVEATREADDQSLAEMHGRIAHVVDPNGDGVEKSVHRVKENHPHKRADDFSVDYDLKATSPLACLADRLDYTAVWVWTAHRAAYVHAYFYFKINNYLI